MFTLIRPHFLLHKARRGGILQRMSSVQEIEMVIPKLSRSELEQLKVWFDDFYEDSLELTDAVKASLDQAHAEIAAGN